MWIIPKLRKPPDIARVGIFLIAITLIVGMVGCRGVTRYALTMAVNPAGAGNATDLTNASPYTVHSPVSINAVAATGYWFVNWAASAGTFANATAAQTTFTMPAQNVIVTANFVQGQPIRTWYDLDDVRNNLGGDYTLMNDLDSTTAGYTQLASPTANGGKGWQPIGSWNFTTFTGTFDGQGYKIRNLFINRPEECEVGLFGCVGVGGGGFIKNVGVVDADVTGGCGTGALVGINVGGNVSDSYSSANVTGEDDDVGGLVGANSGTVSNSYSTGSVAGNNYVGGLVGINGGTVNNSYSSSNLTGNNYVGGLVALNSYTVINSYSSGNVTGNTYLGGLMALNWGTVSNSFWDTETSGQATSAGGTGKTTAEMKDISTFSGATWDIVAVANPGIRNLAYIWNIVDTLTYPFLSWQP